MVAKITTPHSLLRALNYNEQKVQQGKAECLFAGNFLEEAAGLKFYQKLQRFEGLTELNERAQTKTLHISLNFDEKDLLNKEKLILISEDYLQRIGFEKQPYLLYQHHDAGHPHVHIVTTNIQQDGKRIPTHNLGKTKSEEARKSLEREYCLVQAQSKKENQKTTLQAFNAQKVIYGKMSTKRAIQNVLDAVIDHYKYSSLAELNAVLRLYNIMADRGAEDSRMYQGKGLLYRVLDENGAKIGAPVKASAFYSKPTLVNLEQKFAQNDRLKLGLKNYLKVKIDWAIAGKAHTLASLEKGLEREGIEVIERRNKEGILYGMTYIDFKNKVVFNGSDLGKNYSAKGLVEQLAQRMVEQSGKAGQSHLFYKQNDVLENKEAQKGAGEKEKSLTFEKALELVLQPAAQQAYVPAALLKKKRKKKHANRL